MKKALMIALGVLAALAVAFIGYGFTIPAHEADARAARRVCERDMIPRGLATQYDCDQAYEAALRSRP